MILHLHWRVSGVGESPRRFNARNPHENVLTVRCTIVESYSFALGNLLRSDCEVLTVNKKHPASEVGINRLMNLNKALFHGANGGRVREIQSHCAERRKASKNRQWCNGERVGDYPAINSQSSAILSAERA